MNNPAALKLRKSCGFDLIRAARERAGKAYGNKPEEAAAQAAPEEDAQDLPAFTSSLRIIKPAAAAAAAAADEPAEPQPAPPAPSSTIRFFRAPAPMPAAEPDPAEQPPEAAAQPADAGGSPRGAGAAAAATGDDSDSSSGGVEYEDAPPSYDQSVGGKTAAAGAGRGRFTKTTTAGQSSLPAASVVSRTGVSREAMRQQSRAAALLARAASNVQLRVDPNDGTPYSFKQFVECYGPLEGPKLFGTAEVAVPEKPPEQAGGKSSGPSEVAKFAQTLRQCLMTKGGKGCGVVHVSDLFQQVTGRKIDPKRYGINVTGRDHKTAVRMLLNLPQVAMEIEIAQWGTTPTVWARGERPGSSGEVPQSIKVAAAQAEAQAQQAAGSPGKRDRDEDDDGPELRIDPTDGQMYPREAFIEAYGEVEGANRWESAEVVPPGKRRRRDPGREQAGRVTRREQEEIQRELFQAPVERQVDLGVPPKPGQLGVVVETHGMKTKGINGQRGVIFREQPPDRFVVGLPPPFGERALKAEHLKVAAPSASCFAFRIQMQLMKQMRLDVDRTPYQFGSFLQAYGPDEGRRRWEMAPPAPNQEGETADVMLRPAALQEYPAELGFLSMKASLLLIGEGNFSMADDLCHKQRVQGLRGGNILATTIDDELKAYDKYPDCKANVELVMAAGAKVLFGVDATRAEYIGHCVKHAQDQKIDAVLFHFPEVFDRSIQQRAEAERQQLTVGMNRKMLEGFFSALADSPHTRGSRVFVTLKKCPPWMYWDLIGIAQKCGWVLVAEIPFRQAMYPKYQYRCTSPPRGRGGRPRQLEMRMQDAHVHEFRFSYQRPKVAPGEAVPPCTDPVVPPQLPVHARPGGPQIEPGSQGLPPTQLHGVPPPGMPGVQGMQQGVPPGMQQGVPPGVQQGFGGPPPAQQIPPQMQMGQMQQPTPPPTQLGMPPPIPGGRGAPASAMTPEQVQAAAAAAGRVLGGRGAPVQPSPAQPQASPGAAAPPTAPSPAQFPSPAQAPQAPATAGRGAPAAPQPQASPWPVDPPQQHMPSPAQPPTPAQQPSLPPSSAGRGAPAAPQPQASPWPSAEHPLHVPTPAQPQAFLPTGGRGAPAAPQQFRPAAAEFSPIPPPVNAGRGAPTAPQQAYYGHGQPMEGLEPTPAQHQIPSPAQGAPQQAQFSPWGAPPEQQMPGPAQQMPTPAQSAPAVSLLDQLDQWEDPLEDPLAEPAQQAAPPSAPQPSVAAAPPTLPQTGSAALPQTGQPAFPAPPQPAPAQVPQSASFPAPPQPAPSTAPLASI
eukprot:TRINITY_DN30464_c0_g1_i1.p1 TRINITY_DN30464_c0_g1~~TRINITY_DN30464_c0_g1_i1.p1  ORF type:complete len:1283 (+),score=274.61 TRINITY_DN30464_c0_g1_i1:100-3948(+)